MKTSARILSLILLVCGFLWAQPIQAQGLGAIVCMDRVIWEDLFENSEIVHTSQGIGITGNNSIYEVLVTDDGHWVLLKTFSNGQSCRITEGTGWIWLSIEEKPKGQGI